MTNQYIITKRIAKQGKHMMILIPSYLKENLKHKTLVKVTIDILEGENECYNRIGVQRLTPSLVRIPPGLRHGGESNGIWISVKTKCLDHVSSMKGDSSLLYR